MTPDSNEICHPPETDSASLLLAASAGALALTACGGGGGGGNESADPASPGSVTMLNLGTGGNEPALATAETRPSARDAARFLTQASFGIQSVNEIDALQSQGLAHWLWSQFNAPTLQHTSYLALQSFRKNPAKAVDEMSYEAIWQQWLTGTDQLRGRMAFALSQILVISNIAPDLRPYAMSSYMDLLNRNAFGNYRTLLKEVTLHPAMGYYLNMIESEKDDAKRGIHPNENYAREILQLFSIGLVELNPDGSTRLDATGKSIPTYTETEIKGFAKAFSGWTFASQNPADPKSFHRADENLDSNWTAPMRAFPSMHSTEPKKLLGNVTLAANQSPEKDLDDALDNIFNHSNVGPFIGRQLIQRLVTSNPSPAYIQRVTHAFNNNGSGVRGDLKAVVQAVLLDSEARASAEQQALNFGKQREPVIRFATYLRALGAKSSNGINTIHYLDGADDALGQSPLLAPSVFNFFSPSYRQPGAVAHAGLVSPEFQITTETSVVGSLNFFARLINDEAYGWGPGRLVLNLLPLMALATVPISLIDRLDVLLFAYQMSSSTRARLVQMLNAMPQKSQWDLKNRVKAALIVTALSPDFVIQK